ncbi:uncharacterized protein [Mytilus edulis]|uniref:uncharacterized protein isoform X2 n=1 Tax=Mytilus edulis TaxID=6550 RepID=UPI0039EF1CCE
MTGKYGYLRHGHSFVQPLKHVKYFISASMLSLPSGVTRDIKMGEYYKLFILVLTVICISHRTCVAQIFPGQTPLQIPGQIFPGQVIPGQDQVERQQDFFLIDDSGTTDEAGIGSGSALQTALQLFPLALLTLAVPMMEMARTSTASIGTTVVTTTVPTTQTATQTTPCVPTSCPDGYMLLNDQTASPNCYLFSGLAKGKWYYAKRQCTMKGAYLWRPNSEAEANAVKNKFEFGTNEIWTGASSPTHDDKFVFDVENVDLSILSPPFGEFNNFENDDCVHISLNAMNVWEWDDEECLENYRYVCEFPRKTCP